MTQQRSTPLNKEFFFSFWERGWKFVLDEYSIIELLDEIAEGFYTTTYWHLTLEEKIKVVQIAAEVVTSQNSHGL